MKLDHIMLAAPDLDMGISHVQQVTGQKALPGGSHAGAGTRNALLGLGPDQYLEIIAPDPAQQAKGTMAEELLGLSAPMIRTWAAATDDFSSLIEASHQAGYQHHIIDMSRTRPDGVELSWQLLFVRGHAFGMSLPFFINWLDSPHPSVDLPGHVKLGSFEVRHPGADNLLAFCKQIGLDVLVTKGPSGFHAALQSAAGLIHLT